MSDNCKHQFFNMLADYNDEEKKLFVIVVCVYCGQIRKIWQDGKVEITKEYGEIKRPKQNKGV